MTDELPEDTNSFESLTVAQAKQLAQQQGDLSLDGLVAISDEVAEVLSEHVGGTLSLNGLTTLSDHAAAALARHEEKVNLESLTSLTNSALAAKLGPYSLFVNLTEISPIAAQAIADSEDDLDFDKLAPLTVEVAAELARSKVSLSFASIRDLSADVAIQFASHDKYLSFPGLTAISEEAALALAAHSGPLVLEGLTSLPAPVARALSGLKHSLCLWGLTNLTEDAARELGKHSDELYLDAITDLSPAAATGLAAHDGQLYLRGLKTLSRAAAKAMAPHDGFLCLGGLKELPDETMRELAKHKGGLDLDGLTSLSDSALQSLSQFQGWSLSLDGLTTLPGKTAALLARHKAAGLYIGGLALSGLTSISPEAAEGLARFKGRLYLNGLEEVSDDVAARLAAHKGLLSMRQLTTLSDRAADLLGTKPEIEVDDSKWPESAAACFRESRERTATNGNRKGPRPAKPLLDDGGSIQADENSLKSTLMLRDLIVAAPTILSPVGQYSVMLSGDDALSREDFLRDSEVPRKLRSDVQLAVGDYLATLPLIDAPSFACGKDGPDESDAMRIKLTLHGCPAAVFLDAVSPETLQRLYAAAAPAAFGDMKTMETRVDPLVRTGREISADKFTVSRALCEWARQTWASRFQPESVRIEPYKINVYAPGDRFTMHRDTPEKNLVGTFLLALSGWGPPCSGGGLVVHDEVGTFRWDGASGWAAFLPYLPHEVEPITAGARITLAFKVFATSNAESERQSPFDEALLEEAANRIALCRNDRGHVGVLLKYAYSLNGTALCGSDRFIYRALERLGAVQSVPVAVHVKAEAADADMWKWRATANVYELSADNLAHMASHTAQASNPNAAETNLIPFIAASRGHIIYSKGNDPIENTGNYAEPANIETLYVHRALIVREPTNPATTPIRCAAADLAKVDLSGRDLQVADLQGANLAGASLARAKLQRSFLASADLSNANLGSADLTGADLACADLTNAQLTGTCLRDASLNEACLEGVKWDAATIWPDGFDPLEHGAPPMREKPPKKDRRDTSGDDDDERRPWCG
jgi:hypothetical protein